MIVVILVAVAILGCVGPLIWHLFATAQRERALASAYGGSRRRKDPAAFVCPKCVHRTYVPSYVENRRCWKCDGPLDPSAQGISSGA